MDYSYDIRLTVKVDDEDDTPLNPAVISVGEFFQYYVGSTIRNALSSLGVPEEDITVDIERVPEEADDEG